MRVLVLFEDDKQQQSHAPQPGSCKRPQFVNGNNEQDAADYHQTIQRSRLINLLPEWRILQPASDEVSKPSPGEQDERLYLEEQYPEESIHRNAFGQCGQEISSSEWTDRATAQTTYR